MHTTDLFMSSQALVCLLLDNHENRYYLSHGSESRRLNRQPRPLEGVKDETGHPDRTKTISALRSVVNHSPVTPGETGHPGRRSTHLSKGPWWTFANIVICTTQRAEINKPIIRSVTATGTGVSLSWPVLATDNISICQVRVASPAKVSGT